jgi:TATA-box binding protein (TBP) (component of TFIID and TFIIIB)
MPNKMNNNQEKILTLYRSGKNLNLKAEKVPVTYQTVVSMCSAIIEQFIKQVPDSKQIDIENMIYNDINKIRNVRHMLSI